jgi:hypothetical protein
MKVTRIMLIRMKQMANVQLNLPTHLSQRLLGAKVTIKTNGLFTPLTTLMVKFNNKSIKIGISQLQNLQKVQQK